MHTFFKGYRKAMKLSDPYPYTFSISGNIIIILLISVFVGGFLAVFQPFGLSTASIPDKVLVLMGYGLVNLVILSFDLLLLPLMLPGLFTERKWKVVNQIVFLLFIIFTVGLGNYFYTRYFFGYPQGGIRGLVLFQLYTLVIGLFPITYLTILNYNRHLKRNLRLAGNMKQAISSKKQAPGSVETIVVVPSSSKDNLEVALDNLIYLQAEGNYIKVCYKNNDQIKCDLVRSTMKTTQDSLIKYFPPLLRIHRSYIVNTSYVDDVTGNSQGLLLKLTATEEKVPVSRGYVDKVREFFS